MLNFDLIQSTEEEFDIAINQGFLYKHERDGRQILVHRNMENQILFYICTTHHEEETLDLVREACLLLKEDKVKGYGTSNSPIIDQGITKSTTLQEMIELLKNGLSPRIIMKKSCIINRVDFVQYLIENNLFQINEICDKHNRYSILHFACYFYCPEIVKYALDMGIDTNLKDARDCITAYTDLVWRILKQLVYKSSNQEEVCSMLSKNGLPTNLKSNSQVGDVDVNLLESVMLETKGLTITSIVRLGYELAMLRMLRKAIYNVDSPSSRVSSVFQ